MAESAYGGDAHRAYARVPTRQERAARSLLFAGTVLGLIGVTNVVQGVAVLAGRKIYPDNAFFLFTRESIWGGILLAAGLAELIASFAIFTRSSFARWFGVGVAAANAVTQLFVIPAQPLWGVAALAADVVVIHVLLVRGGSAPLA